MHRITSQPEQDWYEVSAYDLWRDLNLENGVGYDALPSLLSVLYIAQAPIGMFENRNWYLAHEGKKLSVVTKPFAPTLKGKARGLMSYKLEFIVQTQGGASESWVYVNTRVRRYIEVTNPVCKF